MKKRFFGFLALVFCFITATVFIACDMGDWVTGKVETEVTGQTLTYEWGSTPTFDGKVTFNGEELTPDKYEVDYSKVDANKVGVYPASVKVNSTNKVYDFEIEITVKKTLKLLMVGNSFSVDAIDYAFNIAKAAGVETIELGNLYIGGCSIDTHYNNYMEDKASYTFYTWYNGDTSFKSASSTAMSTAIASNDWDVISFQQASIDSGYPSTFTNLPLLVEYVTGSCSNENVKTAYHMTWAYRQNATEADFISRYQTQDGMYQAIVDTVKAQDTAIGFDYIIPSGTAIQNARTSWFQDDILNRDYRHLSYYEGRLTAGLTLVGALTGADIANLDYAPMGFSADQLAVCKEAAVNALNKPFEVTQSIYIEIPESEKDEPVPGEFKFDAVTTDNVLASYVLASDDTNINTSKSNVKRHNAIGRLNGPGHMDGFAAFFVNSSAQATAKVYFEFSARVINTAEGGTQNTFDQCFTLTVNDVEVPSTVLMPVSEAEDFAPSNEFTYLADVTLTEGVNCIKLTLITEDAYKGSNIYGMKLVVPETVTLTGTEPVVEPEIDFTTIDWTAYEAIDLGLSNGYWDSTKASGKHNIINSNGKYIATKTFTMETLPVGAIIWVNAGWNYRPEGWDTAEMTRQSKRPDQVTETYVLVTEKWWKGYAVRAFNLNNGTTLTDKFDDVNANFKIYLPIDDSKWTETKYYAADAAGSKTMASYVTASWGASFGSLANGDGYYAIGSLNSNPGRTLTFTVNAKEATVAGLYFQFSTRKKTKTFTDCYDCTVNGVAVTSETIMPNGSDYKVSDTWTFVKFVNLVQGDNVITVGVNSEGYAGNFFGMRLTVKGEGSYEEPGEEPGEEPEKEPTVPFVGFDPANYTLLNLQLVNGFYNPADSTHHAELRSSTTFVTTKLFTKDEIPVGSVIWVNPDWNYRAIWFKDAELSKTTRPDATSQEWTVVDENWFGADNLYRAFNLNNGGTLTDLFDLCNQNFKIYIPKQVA